MDGDKKKSNQKKGKKIKIEIKSLVKMKLRTKKIIVPC
jgi:hypothetical protein